MKTTKILTLIIILAFTSCSTDSEKENHNSLESLQFNQILEFDTNFIEGISIGMTNSVRDNSLYISSRDTYPLVIGENREQLIKVNLNDNSFTNHIFNNSDFITKRLFISNNKLVSFGGQHINTYDLDITNDPNSIVHQKMLSKFKVVKKDDNIFYIIGGDFIGTNSNKIYQWNPNNPQNFIDFTTLPTDIYGGDGVIVDDKLYIFGGSTDSNLNNPTNKIYVVSLSSPNDIQELDLNIIANETFVEKYNDNIIISGIDYNRNFVLAKFNLINENIEIIDNNLNDINSDYGIGQMTLLNDKLYLIFGYVSSMDPPGSGLESKWIILNADLN